MDEKSLQELVHDKLGDYLCIVVSNREPYIHNWVGRKLKASSWLKGLHYQLAKKRLELTASSWRIKSLV